MAGTRSWRGRHPGSWNTSWRSTGGRVGAGIPVISKFLPPGIQRRFIVAGTTQERELQIAFPLDGSNVFLSSMRPTVFFFPSFSPNCHSDERGNGSDDIYRLSDAERTFPLWIDRFDPTLTLWLRLGSKWLAVNRKHFRTDCLPRRLSRHFSVFTSRTTKAVNFIVFNFI